MTGNFGLELGTDRLGNAVVAAAVSGATLSLGGAGGVVSLTNGSGVVVVLERTGLAGSLTGTIALAVPGVSVSGTLTVALNTTGAPISQAFTLNGQTQSLTLAGGIYLELAATGAAITIAGETISGDLR